MQYKFQPDVVDTNLEAYVQTKLYIDPEVEAVLVGFDEHFSYPKILKAASYLKKPNCLFVATCCDETFPAHSKKLTVFPGKFLWDLNFLRIILINLLTFFNLNNFSGTGSFVRCLEAVSGRKAYVVGKPNDYIKNAILKKHNINPARTLMIGDRLVLHGFAKINTCQYTITAVKYFC